MAVKIKITGMSGTTLNRVQAEVVKDANQKVTEMVQMNLTPAHLAELGFQFGKTYEIIVSEVTP